MYTKYKIVPFCPYTILSNTILSGHHRTLQHGSREAICKSVITVMTVVSLLLVHNSNGSIIKLFY